MVVEVVTVREVAADMTARAAAQVPLPAAAMRLLARSEAELVAAQLSSSDDERFVHAHLAALRAGAALLAVVGRPSRRRGPRPVWDLVAAAVPELAGWTAFFADGAPIRSAVEAGRHAGVDPARAEATVTAAEDFQDAVRRHIGVASGDTVPGPGTTLELRAS